MTMSFNEIPDNWRVPLVYCEIDPSRAALNAAEMPYKALILGHSENDDQDGIPQRITSAAQAAKLFGPKSLLAAMAAAWFKANTTTEAYFLPVKKNQGAPAKTTITFGGTAEDGGTIYLYVGDERVSSYVPAEATGQEAAEAVYASLLSSGKYPAALAANAPEITVSAHHPGSYGNNTMVRIGFYQGEDLPAGLTVAFSGGQTFDGSPTPDYKIAAALAGVVAFHGENDPARPFQSLIIPGMLPPKGGAFGRFSGGSGVPDIQAAFAGLGDIQYHLIVSPWTDATTLAALKEIASERWQALKEIPTQIIGAVAGSHTALGELGHRHNSPHLTIMGTGGPFTAQENNLLLYDGVSTYFVNADGACEIQRLITTYKENVWGAEDNSYLDLNTVLTLSYLRRSYRVWMAKRFPRHKLTSDGSNFGYGQAMATPRMIKSETMAWFESMALLGLVENADQFRSELKVERDPNNHCRVNVYLPPDLVNQLRILATQMAFIV